MNSKIYKAVLLLPVINALANVTTEYFPPGTFNPGSLRLVYMLGLSTYILFNYKIIHIKIVNILSIFLIYTLILVLLNNNLIIPIFNYLKIISSMLLVVVGYTIIDEYEKLQQLFKYYMIAFFILNMNFVIANIFGIGHSAYLEDSFYSGAASAGITNEISLYFLIALAFLFILPKHLKQWRIIIISLMLIAAVVILLMLRRGAMLTLTSGLLVFFYFSNLKAKFLRYIVLVTIVFISIFPLFSDVFFERYEYRKSKREGSLANYEIEGRYNEFFQVMSEIKDNGVVRAMFGTHNLNSASYYGRREIHVGYTSILHGSGILGLFLFFLILKRLTKLVNVLNKPLKQLSFFRNIHALYYALLVAFLLYLTTSRLYGFTLTVPFFLMTGAIIGIHRNI